MTAIIKSIRKFENRFDRTAERFAFHHPIAAFIVMFVCMPTFILLAVSVLTMVTALPLALIFGWI